MKIIYPGAAIGIFGSGQLGRMLAIEARRMGYRVHTFSPDSNSPTGQIAELEISAAYDDLDAVRAFASAVDVVTFEFENVPSATVEAAAKLVAVHPKGEILHTTQNRLREKTFLLENGFPVAPFRHIKTLEDLYHGVEELGTPCILKTAGFGYDGKGQAKINTPGELEAAFLAIDENEAVLEAFIDFEKEVSVVCSRGQDGEFVHYGVIENEHKNHILDVSFAPADVSEKAAADAVEIARNIAEKFGYVGTMCVEFFLTGNGTIIVNEIAPRPHNSGHLTIDACVTNQFEQQLRAVCGLPLGSTEYLRPAAMLNLLGDIWQNGVPSWDNVLQKPNAKLHLYGKTEPRPGRKMGHITIAENSLPDVLDAVGELKKLLE